MYIDLGDNMVVSTDGTQYILNNRKVNKEGKKILVPQKYFTNFKSLLKYVGQKIVLDNDNIAQISLALSKLEYTIKNLDDKIYEVLLDNGKKQKEIDELRIKNNKLNEKLKENE